MCEQLRGAGSDPAQPDYFPSRFHAPQNTGTEHISPSHELPPITQYLAELPITPLSTANILALSSAPWQRDGPRSLSSSVMAQPETLSEHELMRKQDLSSACWSLFLCCKALFKDLHVQLSRMDTSLPSLTRIVLESKDVGARLELWGEEMMAQTIEDVLNHSEDLSAAVAQCLQDMSTSMVEGE